MKDIKKPEFMKNALTAKSHSAILEVLIAMLVFFVGDVVIGIIQTPAMVVYLFTNKEYMSMLTSNSFDFAKIMDIALNMPAWVTVVSLVAQIGLIIIFILYCRIFEKRKASTMGFRKKGFVIEYSKGIVIGAVMFVLAYGICFITGSVAFSTVSVKGTTGLYIVAFLIGFLTQGMAEEVICRGYLMVSLSRRYRVTTSIILSSAFFAMLHGMNAGVGFLAFINLFLFGAFMGLLFVRCGNIWVIGAVHSIWNFVQGNVFGVQVSGMQQMPSVFSTEFIKGRELINGGNFGSEGGLAVTLILLAATGLLLWNMSKKGYFVKAEPVNNPHDQMAQNRQFNTQNPYYGQGYQNQPGQNPNYGQGYQNSAGQNPNYGQGYQNSAGQNMDGSAQGYSNADFQRGNITGNDLSNPAKQQSGTYENMGVNPEETPWHPLQENPEEKKMTGFDQSYFKD